MAALSDACCFDHAACDAVLVAPEPDVTKPGIRSCLTVTPPTGMDAEGLCAIPMLLSDTDLYSWA
jgi:hypothetical protein